jgi:hypothetical protein
VNNRFIIAGKVILPALVGYVPKEMIKTISSFLEFCYIVRQNTIGVAALQTLSTTLEQFHTLRTIYQEVGVRSPEDGLSVPRQHSMSHYVGLIKNFGAPNGLCSTLTESAHIRKVKQPWRRTSKNEPLGQILIINQRSDKLALASVDFSDRGMLDADLLGTRSRKPTGPKPQEEDVEPIDTSKSLIGEVQLAKTTGIL